jgi:hypothetical protein
MTRAFLILPLLIGCSTPPAVVDPLPGHLEENYEVFFSDQAPWDLPALQPSEELSALAERARQDYRAVHPHIKLQGSGFFHDRKRHFLFLAFELAGDSPEYFTDFYLVYVFDQSVHRFVGRVHVPMA